MVIRVEMVTDDEEGVDDDEEGVGPGVGRLRKVGPLGSAGFVGALIARICMLTVDIGKHYQRQGTGTLVEMRGVVGVMTNQHVSHSATCSARYVD